MIVVDISTPSSPTYAGEFTSGLAIAADAPKININAATVEELTQLKRIGPKYAEKIVAFREANGPFKTPEELVNVQGIGEKTLEVNKDLIVVK